MQTGVKSDITASKRGSLFKEKDSKNNVSNINRKTGTQHSKYVKKHLSHNLIPGMVSCCVCDDSDYMDAINNY
jgi:hypothetical protein